MLGIVLLLEICVVVLEIGLVVVPCWIGVEIGALVGVLVFRVLLFCGLVDDELVRRLVFDWLR